ncbi:uncharacterized protein LOC755476 isoform X1 [Strongylocentrotus purpuratus]|uniref:Uncharacterized protein n=1 Tax=Strongylocentrotus purpuratus TaxID=7668 RepID=A0A7M7SWE6_STRPU|nr:uncharacterized protein LOC755476 isoform X1 [Strongylocentrotus purpuratus]
MANRSYNNTTQQAVSNQGVGIGTPHSNNVNGNNTTYHRGCVSKGFQVTGIMHIVAGALCIVLGIAAIILQAYISYLAMPIWGGLLIFIATGTIGVANFYKPKSKKIVIAYLVMSTISAFFAFMMMVTFGIFVAQDDNYYESFICYPLPRTHCESPSWSRILVNSVLILVFLLEIACGVTSASMSCYKACMCCRRCCKLCKDEPGNSNMVYFAANMGGVPMMTVPNTQCSRPIYIAGGTSGNATQPSQLMYLAPSPQPQSFVAMPAGTQQNQTIPQLPPPPQYQQNPQLQQQFIQPQPAGMVQQLSGLPAGQAGFVQVQGPGQMQPQGLAQTQPATEQQPSQQPQPAGMVQQPSGPQPGQAGFFPVQVPGQMQPQGLGPSQVVQQPQPAGMVQQLSGSPQVGYFQVQGPGGQIQMIPAQALYPQVMMAPAPQQLAPTPQPVPTQQPGPAQQQVQQTTAPSKPAEDQAKEEVSEPSELPSGQVTSGQFSDQAALI